MEELWRLDYTNANGEKTFLLCEIDRIEQSIHEVGWIHVVRIGRNTRSPVATELKPHKHDWREITPMTPQAWCMDCGGISFDDGKTVTMPRSPVVATEGGEPHYWRRI